ncbi:MAG: ABC transporter permease subunit, partial [Ruthenibacterium sp.]
MTNSLFSLTRMFKIFAKYHTFYFEGLKNTLSISFFAVLIGLALGLLLAFGRMSKIHPLRWICTAYVEVVRSTPLLVQAMI